MSKIGLINRFLRRRGITLVPDWRMEALPLERHLRKLLKAYRIDCVIDVGANLGQFRDLLVGEVGWSGPILSFEPVGAYFRQLEARSTPTWRVFNYALGDVETTREITIFDSPGLASMKQADLNAMSALLPRHSVQATGNEAVRIRTLAAVFDEVTKGIRASRVMLKIDTQGYDLEVLRGAGKVLTQVQVIMTEVPILHIYHNVPDFGATIEEIRAQGYDVSGMFPVTVDDSLRVIEFDCLFVKRQISIEDCSLKVPRTRDIEGS